MQNRIISAANRAPLAAIKLESPALISQVATKWVRETYVIFSRREPSWSRESSILSMRSSLICR